MAPLNRIIIDTDPGMTIATFTLKAHQLEAIITNQTLGVDDILALLLALSASPEELEILLISVTYGNVEVDRLVPRHPHTPQ